MTKSRSVADHANEERVPTVSKYEPQNTECGVTWREVGKVESLFLPEDSHGNDVHFDISRLT